MRWLHLVRWTNLVFVGITHLLFRYFLFPFINLDSSLSNFDFSILSLSIIGVTASGNIINDIFDVESDKVNNRKRPIAKGLISKRQAFSAYIVLIVFSILMTIFFSFLIESWWIVIAEGLTIYLLYAYAKRLKGIALLGNLVISVLVCLSFLLLVLVEIPLEINQLSLYWIVFFAVFAFWVNLNREIIKDIQDMKGDYAMGYKTLPILIGKSRTNTILFISTSVVVIAIIIGVKNYLLAQTNILLYFIFVVSFPLIYMGYQLYKFEEKVDYKRLSTTYKIVMLAGVLSMLFL